MEQVRALINNFIKFQFLIGNLIILKPLPVITETFLSFQFLIGNLIMAKDYQKFVREYLFQFLDCQHLFGQIL